MSLLVKVQSHDMHQGFSTPFMLRFDLNIKKCCKKREGKAIFDLRVDSLVKGECKKTKEVDVFLSGKSRSYITERKT